MACSVNPDRWIVRGKPNPQAALRLFCFPYAGGGAQSYRAWSDGLLDAEVCAIQPPGRESRLKETLFRDASALVDALAPAIRPYLDKRFVLFGHSMGAILAFELARKLRREGLPLPECLFVSARVAPQLRIRRRDIHDLPDREFVEALKHLNGTPETVLQDAELMKLITPLLRADLAIHENYRYSPEAPLECPIFVFGGLHDAEAHREDLEAWREHTRGGFVKRILPGGHFFHNTAQALFLQVLSQEIYRIANHGSAVRDRPAAPQGGSAGLHASSERAAPASAPA